MPLGFDRWLNHLLFECLMISTAIKCTGRSSRLHDCYFQPCSRNTYSTVCPAAARCATCRSLCTLHTMATRATCLPGGSYTLQGSKREKEGNSEGETREGKWSEGGKGGSREWKMSRARCVGNGGEFEENVLGGVEGELLKLISCRVEWWSGWMNEWMRRWTIGKKHTNRT